MAEEDDQGGPVYVSQTAVLGRQTSLFDLSLRNSGRKASNSLMEDVPADLLRLNTVAAPSEDDYDERSRSRERFKVKRALYSCKYRR